MSINQTNPYDIDAHIAEIYDRLEAGLEDVELLRSLIGTGPRLRILEPFCGTGRILIPLAQDGHRLVGLDAAQGMLDFAREKLRRLPQPVRSRIVLRHLDVASLAWPQGFDLVILGNNCLYELATAEEQEACLQSAAQALRPGGRLYLDNDHMEGDLDPSWQEPGPALAFPTGLCADGTYLESTLETVWSDAGRRLVRLCRRTKAVFPDGRTVEKEYIQQKHPVSEAEIRAWLTACGFTITGLFGDHAGSPYQPESIRAIAWAQKME